MCFGGGSTPSAPAPPATPPTPPLAPKAPQQVTKPAQPLKIDKQSSIKRQQSRREESGAVSRGTSQLRVPLNIGTKKSGGLNI